MYVDGVGYVRVKVRGPLPSFECEIWWRADINTYANYDPFAEFEQLSGSHFAIELTPFEVIRHTPCGVWVRSFMGSETFVLGYAIRQLCVPTKQLALQDLVARKQKHASMAALRAENAALMLSAAKGALRKETTSCN